MPLSLERQDLLPARHFIGAEWREASDACRLDVTDPATNTVFASVPDGTAADARAADADLGQLLFHELLDRGFYYAPRGFIALSLPLTDDDLASFVAAYGEALEHVLVHG